MTTPNGRPDILPEAFVAAGQNNDVAAAAQQNLVQEAADLRGIAGAIGAAVAGAGIARAAENAVANALKAVAQQNDQVQEVPQIMQIGDGSVSITRFGGSETVAFRNGPTMTLLPNGGFETSAGVRVTPLNNFNNNFGGKGGRMPFAPETEYRFPTGQWIVTDGQGVSRFHDGRNEYILAPDANGQRTRVARFVP